MPVNTIHPDYEMNKPKWQRIRDVLAGSDEVKSRGQQYLPKPSGHSDDDYSGYVMRTEFYPATQRTVDGLSGAVFRRDPRVVVPDGNEDMLESITTKGTDFSTFAKSVVREVISIGRYGVLVDVRDGENAPFVAGYNAESILNWRVGYIGRSPVLTLVVLQEMQQIVKPDDPFAHDTVVQYRVLSLRLLDDEVNFGADNGKLVYVQSIYQEQKNESGKDSIVLINEIVPRKRGEFIDRIPFSFFGAMSLDPIIQKSPILDLVDTNLSHYRTSAELEEGAYFTGLPMYVISGRGLGEEDAGEFSVGSRTALRLEENGNATVLTVSGDDMGLLKDIMAAKEQRMAVLGARLLEDQKAGVEAAATMAMRHRGENSLLSSMSDTVSRGLKGVLVIMLEWSGVENPEVEVELNRDFTSLQLTGAELVQLTSSYQAGAIGPEVFFKALKDGERIPDGWTVDDWLADIEEGAVAFERGLTNEGADVIDFEQGSA